MPSAVLRPAPGQAGDSPQFRAVLARIKVRLAVGRPRTRPGTVAADKAYSSRSNRLHLRRRRIKAVIPEKSDRAANREKRGSRGGRPVGHDPDPYRQRNTAERCINRIKEWRGLAFRFDRLPAATSPAFIYAEPSCGSEALKPSEDPKSVQALTLMVEIQPATGGRAQSPARVPPRGVRS